MGGRRVGAVTSRRGARWVETRVEGHVLAEHIVDMAAGFVREGAGALWMVDASATDSYDAAAIREAIESFSRLGRENGLRRLVALITRPAVRMGASVVAMSLRATGTLVQVEVVAEPSAFTRRTLDAE